jgi:phytoene dehydrogenase-like protein
MRTYDVVILGAHVAGILAGALLTKKGFSVLMLEEKVKARSARGKYRFRRFSNLSELVVNRTLVEGVYGLLGLSPAPGELSPRNDLRCQILLPGHRVDISPDRPRLLEEIRREFPRDFESIETLYALVERGDWLGPMLVTLSDEPPLVGQMGRWFAHEYRALFDKRLSTLLRSHRGDRTFDRFIDVQMKSMSYVLVDDPPFALASHLLGILLKDEAVTNMVGSRGFVDRVKGEMVGGGGRIKVLESFDTIRVEKPEEEFRVYTKGEKNPISSRVFIGDIPFARLRGLFSKAFSGRRWMVRAERLWPEYFVFSLHLGVDGGGIPVGLDMETSSWFSWDPKELTHHREGGRLRRIPSSP